MQSRKNAWNLLARRTAPVSLVLVGAVVGACYSMDPPAASPQSNPLAEGPPGAASADPSMIAPNTMKVGPPEEEHKKMVFDEAQAKVVLTRAAGNAHTCVDVVGKDQPHGEGQVLVKFTGAGKSTEASIGTPFDGTPIGQCATRAFIGMIVPPFDGADVDMTWTVDLKPDAKKPEAKGKNAPAKKK